MHEICEMLKVRSLLTQGGYEGLVVRLRPRQPIWMHCCRYSSDVSEEQRRTGAEIGHLDPLWTPLAYSQRYDTGGLPPVS